MLKAYFGSSLGISEPMFSIFMPLKKLTDQFSPILTVLFVTINDKFWSVADQIQMVANQLKTVTDQ